ncbi:MAG TPA: DUF4436 family protein [Pyrinomonadaceae bacterium]|nr:DUF4436 family protein [Pyrinomonadaceae bacterium]
MPIKMPATKEIIVGVALLVVFAVAVLLVLRIYKQEGERRSAAISEEGEKDPNHIEVYVKLLAVDPTKGDVSARLEFAPQGSYDKEESGVLVRPLKLYVNSATGKQEHEFPKDKRMNPVDVTVSLYDGLVTDYPFDKHNAFLELYFEEAPSKPAAASGADKASPSSSAASPDATAGAAPTPTPAATGQDASAPAAAAKEGEDAGGDEDVPIAVDFYGSIPGMKITAARTKESTDDYVGIDMTVSRSSTVVFFSLFISALMWGAAIGVLLLVLSVLLRGRKIEVGMFSFLSALLFAMVAVRNSQPGVPPIGTFSDFISFFWAEVILALCLMTILFTWLIRPTAK